MKLTLPQDMKIVQAAAPITTNAAVTGDYVGLKNCSGRMWILVSLNQTVAHATAITVEQATDVAGTDSTAITVAVPIWANEDTATSDALEAQTAAVSYTVGASAADMLVVFQLDAATLADGFDCITVKTAASSQSTNHMSAVYVIDNKYGGDSAPSMIVD
jgi:hypothetical protein